MPTAHTTKSLDSKSNRPSQEPTYFERFGQGVPPAVGKFAANTGQGVKFGQMIRDQVRKGEPVTDWEAFAKPLVEHSQAAQKENRQTSAT